MENQQTEKPVHRFETPFAHVAVGVECAWFGVCDWCRATSEQRESFAITASVQALR